MNYILYFSELNKTVHVLALKTFLNNINHVNDKILEDYIFHWSEYIVPKKTVITEYGKTERYLYFIIEGIQKSYYLHQGKQHVMFFAYGSSFSGVVESFFIQTPSEYFLETITDSKFLRISYKKHSEFIKEHRELETLFRKLTENYLAGVIKRYHELMAFNIETRFVNLLNRSPHLLNMVPQRDIASYLNIDPTNFSKLMNTVKI